MAGSTTHPCHPCQSCGACCAHFRVGFYWREAEESVVAGRPPVPIALTEDYSSFSRCMKGTNTKHYNRCVALDGKIAEDVSCSIYASRPTPCRDFAASFEDGVRRPRCDQARAAYGLAPLRREDWAVFAPVCEGGVRLVSGVRITRGGPDAKS